MASVINRVFFDSLIQQIVKCISTPNLTALKALMKELKNMVEVFKSSSEFSSIRAFVDTKPFENIQELEIDKTFRIFISNPCDEFTVHGTLLDYACGSIHDNKELEIIKYLVEECGFDLNRRNSKNGKTPFLEASRFFCLNQDAFFYMVEKGARLEPRDRFEFTSNVMRSLGHTDPFLCKHEFESRQAMLAKCLEMNFLEDLNSPAFAEVGGYKTSSLGLGVYSKKFNFNIYNWLKANGANIAECKDPILNRFYIFNLVRSFDYEIDQKDVDALKADGFSFTQLDENGNNFCHLLAIKSKDLKRSWSKVFDYLRSQGVNVDEMLTQKNKDGKIPEDLFVEIVKNPFRVVTA